MPGKLRRNNYDLVEDAYDSKSPEINEEAFEHGVTFKVKVRKTTVIGRCRCTANRAIIPWG